MPPRSRPCRKNSLQSAEDIGFQLHSHCPCPASLALDNHRCESCNVRMLSICSALDMSELSEIEHLSRPLCYSPRSVLQREGETATLSQHHRRHGASVAHAARRQRQIIGFAVPGDFLGLDLGENVVFSAEAINQVNACRFPAQRLRGFPQRQAHAYAPHAGANRQRVDPRADHMVNLGRKNADGKVAAFLINLRDRLARIEHVVAHIPLAMTRQDIADYLGLTIETVSRTLSKFAKQKLIVITPDGVAPAQRREAAHSRRAVICRTFSSRTPNAIRDNLVIVLIADELFSKLDVFRRICVEERIKQRRRP